MTSRYDEIMKSKHLLHCHVKKLTEKTIAKAEKELGETEETKAKAIPELRKMVQNEPDLFCPKDDDYMLKYLRPRKFNLKKAFSVLQNFYKVKTSHGELYDSVEFENYMAAFREKAISVFPYRDEDECLVLVIKFANWDPEVVPISNAFVSLTAAILFCVQDATSQINGVKIILDAKGIALKHIRCISAKYIALITRALRDSLPARFKGIHVINESFIFQYLWGILKLLLSEKIKNRFYFHGSNMKNLHKCINKAVLPSEYGGGFTQFDSSDWFTKEMTKYFSAFSELTKYGYKN